MAGPLSEDNKGLNATAPKAPGFQAATPPVFPQSGSNSVQGIVSEVATGEEFEGITGVKNTLPGAPGVVMTPEAVASHQANQNRGGLSSPVGIAESVVGIAKPPLETTVPTTKIASPAPFPPRVDVPISPAETIKTPEMTPFPTPVTIAPEESAPLNMVPPPLHTEAPISPIPPSTPSAPVTRTPEPVSNLGPNLGPEVVSMPDLPLPQPAPEPSKKRFWQFWKKS